MKEKIEYTIKRSRSRRIRIAVHVDGRVVVAAPKKASNEYLDQLVQDKAEWIKSKQEIFRTKFKILGSGGSRHEYYQHIARARKLITEKIRVINQHYNFNYNRVSIKYLRSRWGSCSKSKNLNFNYRLIFLPSHLVDYVVAHEICHLREMNHSHRFWALLAEAIPDCKMRARELRGVI